MRQVGATARLMRLSYLLQRFLRVLSLFFMAIQPAASLYFSCSFAIFSLTMMAIMLRWQSSLMQSFIIASSFSGETVPSSGDMMVRIAEAIFRVRDDDAFYSNVAIGVATPRLAGNDAADDDAPAPAPAATGVARRGSGGASRRTCFNDASSSSSSRPSSGARARPTDAAGSRPSSGGSTRGPSRPSSAGFATGYGIGDGGGRGGTAPSPAQ